jgi:hypothetical protein
MKLVARPFPAHPWCTILPHSSIIFFAWYLAYQISQPRLFGPPERLYKACPLYLPDLIQPSCASSLPGHSSFEVISTITKDYFHTKPYTFFPNITTNTSIRKHVFIWGFRPRRPLYLRVCLSPFVNWFILSSNTRVLIALRPYQADASSTRKSLYRGAATVQRGPLMFLTRYH